MDIAIIVPTYNEKNNIGKLIPGIFGLDIDDLHIIIVDDNSPDGTGKIARDLKNKFDRLHVLHRNKKAGLGTAYIHGFQYALANGARYIFEMDADFSHDHKLIPIFLEHLNSHDLVIGSRYMDGGKIENWNWTRRMVSSFGNSYAKKILKMPFYDLTTGYKGYRREVVEHLVEKNINAISYVFQIETTWHAHKYGFRIKEIPITFTERKTGKSKFRLMIIWDAFWRVLKLRFTK